MNDETIDQEWRQMESRINKMIGGFLDEDYPSIEYNSRSVEELTMQPGYNDDSTLRRGRRKRFR